jgi:hypothetical protein
LSEAAGNIGRLYWKPRAQRTVVLEVEEENERKKKKKGCDVMWSGRHLPTCSYVLSSLLQR